MTIGFAYKDGRPKAFTASYDDGHKSDLRLMKLFDKYGIKGTFHLISGRLGAEKFVSAEQVATEYVGHEVSVHTLTHPYLERLSDEEVVHEIMEDRKNLESMCGYPVRGMSYPYGTYTPELIGKLRALGMQYARTTKNTGKFKLPDDFMAWHPTCKHADPKLFEYLENFKVGKSARRYGLPLFYLWGHSFEFRTPEDWAMIERFCAEVGNDPEVWYATNIEIYDYVTALRALRFSADRTMVYNPTATDVWVMVDATAVVCPAGQVTKLIENKEN